MAMQDNANHNWVKPTLKVKLKDVPRKETEKYNFFIQ